MGTDLTTEHPRSYEIDLPQKYEDADRYEGTGFPCAIFKVRHNL